MQTYDVELRLKDSHLVGRLQPNEATGELTLWLEDKRGNVVGRSKLLGPAQARKFMQALNVKRPDNLVWATLGYSRLPDWKAQGFRSNPLTADGQPGCFYQPKGQSMRHARAKTSLATFSRG